MSIYGQELELKDLIGKISSLELPEVDIKDLCNPCPAITIDTFISSLKTPEEFLIVDVRSEAEYEEIHIPGAVNIPIFNNRERHNVGLLFKQKSERLAEQVGAYYAFSKQEQFLQEIQEQSNNREVIVHCWRGGYRSQSVTALLNKNSIDAVQLNGGIKAFRRKVHHTLYESRLKLMALSGQTGTGKSEILEKMQTGSDIPILHLEEAACHASSVFGPVRFGCSPIEKQQEFETRIFMQMLPWIDDNGNLPVFLTEKESSKIGRLTLPPSIQAALNEDRHIRLDCTLAARVERLRREYINQLTEESKIYLRERLTYLKRMLSKEKLHEYLDLFDREEWNNLLEKILVEYYDVVYKKTLTEPISDIDSTDVDGAISKITNIIRNEGQK